MPERPTLVCAGNVTLDVAVAPDGRRTTAVGGDAVFASLAARLAGGEPQILAPLGNDVPDAVADVVRLAGTPPEDLPARDLPTVLDVVRYRADGSRTWELVHGERHFEEMSPGPADVTPAMLAADGVLLSGMALAAQLALSSWLRPRTSATVYLDPQEDYVPGNERALLEAVAACDVFLPSEVEALALARVDDVEDAIRCFLEVVPVVVVKRAEHGCLVATRRGRTPVVVPAERVVPTDSTGAGDAFCGAFAVEHLRSGDPVAAARAASAVARVAVSGVGVDALADAVRSMESEVAR
ncbi:carbohydrate kinase family protein [Luteimicrobium subarcticum]|uniref:Ribokinase n=1 Tax=Luteimicrobium subarcticum TaxID=620910 RepID=A0A2M8WRH8_9MICO|nr:carbohydrate kinase family protein [Luteimicrobium subarcticum]PJI93528.1 ribokinase [Luteimicrobium subarcticum]